MINSTSTDLLLAIKQAYNGCGFQCTNIKPEEESGEYSAYTFFLNNKFIVYREAKITPTKVGQFVTLWKRKPNGTIEPFEISDKIDFVIITVRNKEQIGQFVFSKSVLIEKGVFSSNNKEGKRAIRVYPPWDKTTSKQAEKTQTWQSKYFFSMEEPLNIDFLKGLLNHNSFRKNLFFHFQIS